MFTGIIETQGIVDSVKKNGKNLELTILSSISDNLRVDQSVSHDGVCLTITSKNTILLKHSLRVKLEEKKLSSD